MALPATIQTIVRLVGHAKAMALVHDLGGQSYRFPVSNKSDVWEYLVELIGARSAEVLCQEFGGNEVYIALCNQAIKADRNRSMIARYEALLTAGHSSRGAVTVLVREFRLSNRQIENIINGPSPAGDAMEMATQGSLF